MIAYGCVIGSEDRFNEQANAGISLVSGGFEPFTVRGASSIFVALNELCDRAREIPDVEALVLPHDDLQLLDPGFETKLRRELEEPDVAVIGAIGGEGVRDMGWWNCENAHGGARWQAPDGAPPFGSIPGGWDTEIGPGTTGDVDAVDGMLLIITRLGLERLRFDERLGPGFHGYDADICFQALEQGLRVRAMPIDCIHFNDGVPSERDRDAWKLANARFRRKWESRWPPLAGRPLSLPHRPAALEPRDETPGLGRGGAGSA